MEKILKTILLALILLIIIISVFFQIKAETYINDTKEKYGVFVYKERERYKPFILFILESNILKKHKFYWKTMDNPYKEVGLYEGYTVIPMYSAYINYCYASL